MEHGDIEPTTGTSGQVFTSNGPGTVATFQTPAGVSFIGFNASGQPSGSIVPATPKVCDNLVGVNFNIGTLFVGSTGLLTETIDAYWQLNCNIRLRNIDSAASSYSLQLQGGSETIGYSYDPRQNAADIAGDTGFSISGTFHILNTETAFCEVTQTGGATQTTIDHCYFSGHRIALA